MKNTYKITGIICALCVEKVSKILKEIKWICILIMSVQLMIIPVFAQQDKQMLIFKIEGNNYIRMNYDKNGELKNSQIFIVGKVVVNKDQYLMPLKIYLYNNKGELGDSTITNYTCKPSDNKVLMNIFPFSKLSADKTVKVALNNGEFYPENIVEGGDLEELSFSASIEGGVAGAFGSSTKIKVYNRKTVNVTKETYHISSKIEIKAYLIGLKLKTINYLVEETISKQKGILEQKFKEENGEYFTIKLKI